MAFPSAATFPLHALLTPPYIPAHHSPPHVPMPRRTPDGATSCPGVSSTVPRAHQGSQGCPTGHHDPPPPAPGAKPLDVSREKAPGGLRDFSPMQSPPGGSRGRAEPRVPHVPRGGLVPTTLSYSSRVSLSPAVLLKLLVLEEEREMFDLPFSFSLMKGLGREVKQNEGHVVVAREAVSFGL